MSRNNVCRTSCALSWRTHYGDVIKWKHFPRYWPFVRGIHRSPVNSSHKGQWRGTLMFSLICTWINGWVNNGEAGDLRHNHAHHDVIVMSIMAIKKSSTTPLFVHSCVHQRKHQNPASLAPVEGIHRPPANSPYKGPVMRKIFPYYDIIMGWPMVHTLS